MEKEKVTFTETEIIARKIQLEEQYQSAQSMVAALGGAIQDCDWWLNKLAEKEVEAKKLAAAEQQKVAEEATAKKKKRKK